MIFKYKEQKDNFLYEVGICRRYRRFSEIFEVLRHLWRTYKHVKSEWFIDYVKKERERKNELVVSLGIQEI